MLTWYLDRKTYLRSLERIGDLWLGDATGFVSARGWASRIALAVSVPF